MNKDLLDIHSVNPKPKFYKVIPIFYFIQIAFMLYVYVPGLKYFYFNFYEYKFTSPQYIFLTLLLIYPIIGLSLYYKVKKAGWFICTHYAGLSLLILFMILINHLNEEKENTAYHIHYIEIIVSSFQLIFNFFCLFWLFKKPFLYFFSLKRDHIFYLILLFIASFLLLALIS